MPINRKVALGLVVALVGLVLPLVGVYTVSPQVQGLITAGEYAAAAWLVKEEGKLFGSGKKTPAA